jgi:hypothetical protein
MCDPLREKLLKLDIERNRIRAQMEDRELEHLANSEKNASAKARAIERWAKRQDRRKWEQYSGFSPIPPGPWSEDLDNYHNSCYTIDLGDDYVGQLRRSSDATFNGYVILPEGHPLKGLDYRIYDQDSLLTLPCPPQEITYSDCDMFGFDHCHSWDVKPSRFSLSYKRENYYDCALPSNERYVCYGDAVEEVKELGEYFKMIEREYYDQIIEYRARIHSPVSSAMKERHRVVAATIALALALAPAPPTALVTPTTPATLTATAIPTAIAVPVTVKPTGVKRSWAAVVSRR